MINGRSGIQTTDVLVMINKLQIRIRGSKTDQSMVGDMVFLERAVNSPKVCPVSCVLQYLKVRPDDAGSLLVHFDQSKLTRYQFQAVLKKAAKFLNWNPKGFTSHSFRIGAATTAAMNGLPITKIMEKGRWKSHAVKSYIRPNVN